jgi:hypothetical protein
LLILFPFFAFQYYTLFDFGAKQVAFACGGSSASVDGTTTVCTEEMPAPTTALQLVYRIIAATSAALVAAFLVFQITLGYIPRAHASCSRRLARCTRRRQWGENRMGVATPLLPPASQGQQRAAL